MKLWQQELASAALPKRKAKAKAKAGTKKATEAAKETPAKEKDKKRGGLSDADKVKLQAKLKKVRAWREGGGAVEKSPRRKYKTRKRMEAVGRWKELPTILTYMPPLNTGSTLHGGTSSGQEETP